MGGGVAANHGLRDRMSAEIAKLPKADQPKVILPDIKLCGDNAAMIAFRAKSLYENGVRDTFSCKPFPALSENHFLPHP